MCKNIREFRVQVAKQSIIKTDQRLLVQREVNKSPIRRANTDRRIWGEINELAGDGLFLLFDVAFSLYDPSRLNLNIVIGLLITK